MHCECAEFTHIFTTREPANGYAAFAYFGALWDPSVGFLHHDGSVSIHVNIENLAPGRRQGALNALHTDLATASLSTVASPPKSPSLARMVQRAVTASLRIPKHIWQRQTLLHLLPPWQSDGTPPCPRNAFADFYDSTITRQGVTWQPGNTTAYRLASFVHACILHWRYQHFSSLYQCAVFVNWKYLNWRVEGTEEAAYDPAEYKEVKTDIEEGIKRSLEPATYLPPAPGLEVYFESKWPDLASSDLLAEDILKDLHWDIDEGIYMMSVDVAASNDSLSVGGWGAFEQVQKWREYGRRGWLRPMPSSWLVDTSQLQIELWRNTLTACQTVRQYPTELYDTCVRGCLRRPGGPCLFRKPYVYDSTMLAGALIHALAI